MAIANQKRRWEVYPSVFQREIIEAVIGEQALYDEALSISCGKHKISVTLFQEELQKHPDLVEKFHQISHRVGKLSESKLINMSLEKMHEILEQPFSVRTEEKWDPKEKIWVPARRVHTANTEAHMSITRFLLEKMHNSFNPKLKEIKLQSAMDILKELAKNDKFTTDDAKAIERSIANYLRDSGLDAPTDNIDDIEIN